MAVAYVFFIKPGQGNTLRHRFASLAFSWLVGEKLAHVSISDGTIVLDPGLNGDWYAHFWPYRAGHTHLSHVLKVQTPELIQLSGLADPERKSIFRNIVEWISRGWIKPSGPLNCTDTVMAALLTGGLDVLPPHRRIVTPRELDHILTTYHGATRCSL